MLFSFIAKSNLTYYFFPRHHCNCCRIPAQTVIFYKTEVEIESVRQDIAKGTRNTEDQTKFAPVKILIKLLDPTLGGFYKTLYKHHMKIVTKLTYKKKLIAKHVDILC